MRTTLSIDDDVLQAVRERARHERRTAGQVISELARSALTRTDAPPGDSEEFHGFRPLPRRGVIVTSELINQIREEEGI